MPRAAPHNRIQIKERREDVLVLLTKGMKGYEIAKELGVAIWELCKNLMPDPLFCL